MANPIYNQFNKGPGLPGMLGNLSNLVQQFNQFRQTFQGDPQAKVKELMDSGQLSQQQLDQLTPIAQQLQGLLFHR